MTLIEERKFKHDDKEFLIKLFEIDSGYKAVAFLDGVKASATYEISFEANTDYFAQYGDSFKENLFDQIEADIDYGRCLPG